MPVEVKVVRWPAQARERERYRHMGVPLILVLEESVPPPSLDALEDCIRQPIAPDDMHTRLEALRTRALATVPVIDSADILRFGGNWLALSPTDARLMHVLLESFQNVVTREHLIDAVWPDAQPRRNALDLRILRLRRRIAPLGLMISTVRRKGYLLDRKRSTTEPDVG